MPLESIFLDLQAQLVDGKLNGEDAVVEGPQPHSYLWKDNTETTRKPLDAK